MKLLRILPLLCALVLPQLALAQSSPSVDDKVRYIFQVTDFQKGVQLGFDAFKPLLLQQIKNASSKITPELADHILSLADQELAAVQPQLLQFAVDYYKKQLSDDEIGALYDFYRTPVGAGIAGKTSTIMSGLAQQTQQFMATQYTPRIQKRLAEDPQLQNALKP